jgi:hypothetical protein
MVEQYNCTESYIIVSGVFRYSDKDSIDNTFKPWNSRFSEGNLAGTNEYLRSNYYKTYLNCVFPESLYDNKEFEKCKTHSKYTVENGLIDKPCYIETKNEEQVNFGIDYIDLHIFQYGIGVFSVKIDLGELSSLANYSFLSIKLKDLDTVFNFGNEEISIGRFIDRLVFKQLKTNDGVKDLNSSLKVYMSLGIADELDAFDIDYLLYDLGNFSPLGSAKGEGIFAPSKEYYSSQMSKHKISIFNNWSALALHDSFTRVSMNFPDKYKSWEIEYFNLYVFNLYKKFFLYNINNKLANHSLLSKETHLLRNQYVKFLSVYDHRNISYKFLPELIKNKIEAALELKDEMATVNDKLDTLNQFYQEYRDKSINATLFIIALISIIGVAFNISQWLVESGAKESRIFPFGSLIILLLTSLIVVVALLLTNYRNKRRMK